jgi:hypothetical protein
VGGAVFAGLAALGWIAERALRLSNPLGGVVGAIAAHPILILFSLVGVAVTARVGDGLAERRRLAGWRVPDGRTAQGVATEIAPLPPSPAAVK